MHLLGRDRFRAKDFEITDLPLEIPGLDLAFEGYRIIQITDLHVGHWLSPERLAGVVDLINQQTPDLVVITGDFVSYVLQGVVDEMIASFRRLQPKEATLAILGNHDHWMGAENLRQIFAQCGIIELANAVYTLRRGEARLYIAGLDDITVGAHDLEGLLAQLPVDAPAILLAHEPDYADVSAQTGRFALQLSGHSHGGQIVLPKIGAAIRGPGFFKYPKGLYQVGAMQLYTNRGIGTHVFRLRYNCPPEIALITLKRS
ncbi:MAG TPA: metallophosphoesterase [Chloroflexi bacterium]|nr:metallophosphoesterase [Chloroflexota bacterium]